MVSGEAIENRDQAVSGDGGGERLIGIDAVGSRQPTATGKDQARRRRLEPGVPSVGDANGMDRPAGAPGNEWTGDDRRRRRAAVRLAAIGPTGHLPAWPQSGIGLRCQAGGAEASGQDRDRQAAPRASG